AGGDVRIRPGRGHGLILSMAKVSLGAVLRPPSRRLECRGTAAARLPPGATAAALRIATCATGTSDTSHASSLPVKRFIVPLVPVAYA
ncbi:hypothetical protein WDZ92_46500, partial [Nostoc sp. NIES-2111]